MNDLISSAKDNLSFLLVCVAIIVGIALVAWLAQRFLCHSAVKATGTRREVFTALFSAVAAVLMLLEIPLFFAPSFYKLDLSELPVLLCSFYLGPTAGVICELVKVILKLLLKGTSTASEATRDVDALLLGRRVDPPRGQSRPLEGVAISSKRPHNGHKPSCGQYENRFDPALIPRQQLP